MMIRRRTLTLIIGLMLTGLAVIRVLNLHDSNHEIAEVYDAQLAQNARMLQGVMRMPLASKQHAELYQAFNQALSEAEPKVDGHPYETKIAFQVWNRKGEVLVHTASAPSFTAPPATPGFSDVVDLNNRHWRAFLLEDKQNELRIWVGERDDVRADLVDRIVRHTLWPNLLGEPGARGDGLDGHWLGPQAPGRHGRDPAGTPQWLARAFAPDAPAERTRTDAGGTQPHAGADSGSARPRAALHYRCRP